MLRKNALKSPNQKYLLTKQMHPSFNLFEDDNYEDGEDFVNISFKSFEAKDEKKRSRPIPHPFTNSKRLSFV